MAYVSSWALAVLTSVLAFAVLPRKTRPLPGDHEALGADQYATSMCLGS